MTLGTSFKWGGVVNISPQQIYNINMLNNNSQILHSIIVNAIIEKDGKILISQRSFEEKHEPGKWTIPGGKVEFTHGNVFHIIEKTLAKEVKEEVGIKISANVELLTNNTFIRSDGTHVVALMFLCHYESGEAKPLEDTLDVRWIAENELSNYDFSPNVEGYIKLAFEKLKITKI